MDKYIVALKSMNTLAYALHKEVVVAACQNALSGHAFTASGSWQEKNGGLVREVNENRAEAIVTQHSFLWATTIKIKKGKKIFFNDLICYANVNVARCSRICLNYNFDFWVM